MGYKAVKPRNKNKKVKYDRTGVYHGHPEAQYDNRAPGSRPPAWRDFPRSRPPIWRDSHLQDQTYCGYDDQIGYLPPCTTDQGYGYQGDASNDHRTLRPNPVPIQNRFNILSQHQEENPGIEAGASWHPSQFMEQASRFRQEQLRSPRNPNRGEQPQFFPLANIRPKRGQKEGEVPEGVGGSRPKKKETINIGGVFNLSMVQLSKGEQFVLNQGLKFAPPTKAEQV